MIISKLNKKNTEIIEKLDSIEPLCNQGQSKIVWHKGRGVYIYDKSGKKYLDLTSSIMVTNLGHNVKQIKKQIIKQVKTGILHSYSYPTEIKLKFLELLANFFSNDKKILLRTTGTETIEAAIKLVRTYFIKKGKINKNIIISFKNSFHGRTMGSQLVGGYDYQKEWIFGNDFGFYNIYYPDGYFSNEEFIDSINKLLNEKNIDVNNIAAIIIEIYQGTTGCFVPNEYMEDLKEYCLKHDIKIVIDEVQSGFFRTGKMFGYEYYNINPNMICIGKAISGGLPVAAVVGDVEIMDSVEKKLMGSTHAGHPIALAGAYANLKIFQRNKNKIMKNVNEVGNYFYQKLKELMDNFPSILKRIWGRGLIFGLLIIKNDKLSSDTARFIVSELIKRKIFLFTPVGPENAVIKFTPPLIIKRKEVDYVIKNLREILINL